MNGSVNISLIQNRFLVYAEHKKKKSICEDNKFYWDFRAHILHDLRKKSYNFMDDDDDCL